MKPAKKPAAMRFDCIEVFHNPQRKHAGNGLLSPMDFEQQQKLKLQGVQEITGYSAGSYDAG